MYDEEDFLQLAGLQHFAYCQRQWALIHVENQWAENLHTVEGQIIHDKAHDASIKESRGKTKIVRAMKIRSFELGLSGECDVVEFNQSCDGVFIQQFGDKYELCPVEYKKGQPKTGDEDIVQLVAQVVCLEEMLATNISKAFLYYYQVRSRHEVIVTDELRSKVRKISRQMHSMMRNRHTPKVKVGRKCIKCSLKNICLPEINKNRSVKRYLARRLS